MKAALLLLLVTAVPIGGCATNTIRLDRASAMGQAGAAAVVGTKTALEEVDEANREKLIAIAALDPACELPTPVIAALTRDGVLVCIPLGDKPIVGDTPLRRFDSRSFAPSIATLNALAVYLGAMDAILTDKRVDVGAELDDAIVKLQTAAGDVATIAGTELPTVIKDEQRTAVAEALSLLSSLSNEADTVRDLQRFETPARDEEFAATVSRLQAVNDGLVEVLRQEIEQQKKVLQLTRSRTVDPRAHRREEMALLERKERIGDLKTALAGALDALATSRTDYVTLLRDRKASLSKDERKKRSQVAQQRVLGALSAVAKLAMTF